MREMDGASPCVAVRRAGAAADVVQPRSVPLGSSGASRFPIIEVIWQVLALTLHLWRLIIVASFNPSRLKCAVLVGGCLRLGCSKRLLSKELLLSKGNSILFHPH